MEVSSSANSETPSSPMDILIINEQSKSPPISTRNAPVCPRPDSPSQGSSPLPGGSSIADEVIAHVKAQVHEIVGNRYTNRNFARPPSNAANNPWYSASNVQRSFKRNLASTFRRRITNPEEARCTASTEEMFNFFSESVATLPADFQWSPDREFLPIPAPPPDQEELNLAQEPSPISPVCFDRESSEVDRIEENDPNHPLLRPPRVMKFVGQLKRTSNTPPGLDRITYKDLKKFDPHAILLHAFYHLFWKNLVVYRIALSPFGSLCSVNASKDREGFKIAVQADV
ncbi:DgyrCDS14926 [Dimorphilus gyrociliatus]|uniref:DgyrCDS14926 n=1 Tax=Dimorphilus gyrociliatus TaxID=2664684 RepID=A0A7I8WFK8_9ANNE|nr:DgyrCDS14926 [Dimorphilus gyrociliatus]